MAALVNAPTRDYHTMIMNSARWDGYRPRTGDVIVATYPKCGTTWTQRIVGLLIHQSPALMGELAAAATFEAMKRDGEALLPRIGEHFDTGSQRFLHKGTNGRWKDFLTSADLARYDALVTHKLSPALGAWIEHGGLVAGDPRVLPD